MFSINFLHVILCSKVSSRLLHELCHDIKLKIKTNFSWKQLSDKTLFWCYHHNFFYKVIKASKLVGKLFLYQLSPFLPSISLSTKSKPNKIWRCQTLATPTNRKSWLLFEWQKIKKQTFTETDSWNIVLWLHQGVITTNHQFQNFTERRGHSYTVVIVVVQQFGYKSKIRWKSCSNLTQDGLSMRLLWLLVAIP